MPLVCYIFVSLMTLTSLVSGAKRVDVSLLAQSNGGQSMDRRDIGSDVKTQLDLPTDVDVQETDSVLSAQGTTTKRYQETYKGIKVYNTIVDSESQDDTGNEDIVAGDIFVDFDEDLADALDCEISNEEAKELIMEQFGGNTASITHEEYEDIIYVDDNSVAKYSTQVSLSAIKANGNPMRPFGFVDKCEKIVLHAYDRSGYFTTGFPNFPQTTTTTTTTAAPTTTTTTAAPTTTTTTAAPTTTTTAPPAGSSTTPSSAGGSSNCDVKAKGGNPKKVIQYGTAGYCLTPMKRSADRKWCYLENEYVKTVDLKGGDEGNSTTTVKFECTVGYPNAKNGGYHPAFDGFYFGTRSAQMYRDWYKYEPRKNNPPYVKVNYKQNVANAYWDGTSLLLGDGGEEMYPFTTLDTVAHELGHGVMEEKSNLAYEKQSGGMNEAFADMVGEAAEEYVFGKSDFVSGNEMYKAPGKAMRYFDDPTKDGSSIKHVSNYTDSMDVHYSSGVYNHVFWQMAQVKGMGIRAAFECFLYANILFWTSTTGFEAGACGTLRATYNRGYDMDLVKESFSVTGITSNNCNDLSQLVSASLSSGGTRNNLAVSKLRNPLFKMVIPSGKSSLTATVTGGVKVAISQSYKRSDTALDSGQSSATANVSPGDTVYIRVYKDDNTEVDNISLTVN